MSPTAPSIASSHHREGSDHAWQNLHHHGRRLRAARARAADRVAEAAEENGEAMIFTGAALPRSPQGLAAAAAKIGCEPAALQAVLSVEAAGSGFDALKRPKMLFEPHIFYGLLERHEALKLGAAIKAGVAYPKWGMRPYPKDSYPHLTRAVALDETLALDSASWGLGQLLGQNFAKAGYASPQAMVTAFADGENAQLAGMA